MCQRRRRVDYHRLKIQTDANYRDTVRNSQSKWREQHPDYWKEYRRRHPESAERKRQQQKRRDGQRGPERLAKNNLGLGLETKNFAVWVVEPAAPGIAKNNLSSAQRFIFQTH